MDHPGRDIQIMLPITLAFIKLAPFTFAAGCASNNLFFFLPPWYKYLAAANPPKLDSSCNLTPNFIFPTDTLLIGLAILDMLIRLAGFVAVISIVVAGVQYIMASGNPEKGVSARKRLTNSLIGLGIALIATATVSFIGGRLAP